MNTIELQPVQVAKRHEREPTLFRLHHPAEITVHLENSSQVQPQQEPKILLAHYPSKNMGRLTAVCLFMVLCGMSDATTGALLPDIERHYHISYGVVSLVWVGNAIGFVLVACMSFKLQAWFSHRDYLLFGALLTLIMYAIVSSGTKFPAIVAAFFFGGFGLAMCLSKSNVFLALFDKKQSKYLSIAQSGYGVGATISPLIATSFVTAGINWNLFYLVLLGIAIVTIGLFAYYFTGSEELPWDLKDELVVEDTTNHYELLRIALRNKVTWLIALFTFFYQGAEVSIGGWIVTFLQESRNGGKSVGYVASGFWSGVTLGRLLLTGPMYKYIGPRRSVILCLVISLIAVGLTWAIPNFIAAGTFVSVAGVFVGPNYPIMLKLASELFPRKIHIIALTITTAFGSSGGAFFPFIVGILSQRFGTFVVLPSFLVLYCAMLVFWLALPNRDKVGAKWYRVW